MLATDTSVYLFILEACLCPFGRPVKFETKRENPFFLRHVEQCARAATAWTSAPSSDGACLQTHTETVHAGMHSKAHHAQRGNTQTHTHLSFFFFYFSGSFLSLWVVLEYLRCVIRHWFPSEPEGKKKYLTERYIKRGHSEFLTFFAQLLQNE